MILKTFDSMFPILIYKLFHYSLWDRSSAISTSLYKLVNNHTFDTLVRLASPIRSRSSASYLLMFVLTHTFVRCHHHSSFHSSIDMLETNNTILEIFLPIKSIKRISSWSQYLITNSRISCFWIYFYMIYCTQLLVSSLCGQLYMTFPKIVQIQLFSPKSRV